MGNVGARPLKFFPVRPKNSLANGILSAIHRSIVSADLFPRINATEQTVTRLRDEIVSGVRTPGELLPEAGVARSMGVSRVPVREALIALEREGLVEFSATGRARVTRLTSEDFAEIFTLRMTLEPAATRIAARSLAADTGLLEENIRRTERAQSMGELTLLDLDFHELIVEAAKNSRMLKLWRSLRSELELWLSALQRRHHFQTKLTQSETVASHQHIVRSLRTENPAGAERLMRKHILSWREWLPLLNDQP